MYNLDNDYFLNSLETFVIPSSEWYVIYLSNIQGVTSLMINVNTNQIAIISSCFSLVLPIGQTQHHLPPQLITSNQKDKSIQYRVVEIVRIQVFNKKLYMQIFKNIKDKLNV